MDAWSLRDLLAEQQEFELSAPAIPQTDALPASPALAPARRRRCVALRLGPAAVLVTGRAAIQRIVLVREHGRETIIDLNQPFLLLLLRVFLCSGCQTYLLAASELTLRNGLPGSIERFDGGSFEVRPKIWKLMLVWNEWCSRSIKNRAGPEMRWIDEVFRMRFAESEKLHGEFGILTGEVGSFREIGAEVIELELGVFASAYQFPVAPAHAHLFVVNDRIRRLRSGLS